AAAAGAVAGVEDAGGRDREELTAGAEGARLGSLLGVGGPGDAHGGQHHRQCQRRPRDAPRGTSRCSVHRLPLPRPAPARHVTVALDPTPERSRDAREARLYVVESGDGPWVDPGLRGEVEAGEVAVDDEVEELRQRAVALGPHVVHRPDHLADEVVDQFETPATLTMLLVWSPTSEG